MTIHLHEHFGYKKLLRFTIPSIAMVVFSGVYGAVDGIFVANFTDSAQFAAVNLVYPILFILCAFGFMIGAGGSALISKTMGEGDNEKANEIFSFLVFFSLALSTLLSIVGILVLRPVSALLTDNPEVQNHCVTYGTVLLCSLPAAVMQFEFGAFFVTAERPKLGLLLSVAAGCTNIALDALFIILFKWGIVGASIATVCGYMVGGAIPFIYFLRKNGSPLRLGRTRLHFRALLKACTNGFSEFVTNVSVSAVTILYNAQLQKYAGLLGVNAYAAIACIGFIFLSIFLGYSSGVAPVIGYHFGAKNKEELRGLMRRSLIITCLFSILLFCVSLLLSAPMSALYAHGDSEMYEMTRHGFILYCFAYLVAGFNIFGSAFFTALNDGASSAAISILRTLVLQVLFIFLLPLLWGLNGIWLAALFSEITCLIVTLLLFILLRKKYGY